MIDLRNRLSAELKAIKDAKFAPHGDNHPPEATCNYGMYVTKFPFKGYDDKEAAKKRTIVKANQSAFMELSKDVQVDNIKNYLDSQPMNDLRVEIKKSNTLFDTNPREAKRVEMEACEKVHNHIENLEFAVSVLDGKYKSPVVKTKIDYYDPIAVFDGINKFTKQMCSGGRVSKRKIGDVKIQEFKDLKSTLDVQTKAYHLDDYASDDIYDGLMIRNCGTERQSHVGKRTDEQALSALRDYEGLMLHLQKVRNNYVTEPIHEPAQAELRKRTELLNKIYEHQNYQNMAKGKGNTANLKVPEIKRYEKKDMPNGLNPYQKMVWLNVASCPKREPSRELVEAAAEAHHDYIDSEMNKAKERANNVYAMRCGVGKPTYQYLKRPKPKSKK